VTRKLPQQLLQHFAKWSLTVVAHQPHHITLTNLRILCPLQSQLLCDQEASTAAIAALRKVVADQESVISRLESLLAAAAARNKEGEGWRSTADALQAEVMRLR
jgi:hypothetical protein